MPGAKPAIVPGPGNKASADGGVLDEADLLANVLFVRDVDNKSPFQDMAAQVFSAVEVLEVLHLKWNNTTITRSDLYSFHR